ncbi:hypothetical protein [Kitasatospora terrestris]|uniref:Uncharacterized protein n=1 Tax=Kitasatospora terrestris TaxID=258051 RepID=A0ABP9EXN4_9ACTN
MYARSLTEEFATGFAIHLMYLPDDPYGVQVVTVGQDVDVVRVRRERAERVIGFLGDDLDGIIEDIAHFYWLVPAGTACLQPAEPADEDVEMLGPRWSVTIPGSRYQGRRRWYGDYGTLADPGLLCKALAATRDTRAVLRRVPEAGGPTGERQPSRMPRRRPQDCLEAPDAVKSLSPLGAWL